jgi:2-iminobutanoate/2-iminopropanoate deaminase
VNGAGTPISFSKFSKRPIDRRESSTFTALENCTRIPPAAFAVDPMPAADSFSRTATSVRPRRARCHAIEVPMIPAPMITTPNRWSAMRVWLFYVARCGFQRYHGGPMTKKIVTSDQAPKAIGPYSQAVDGGDLVFLSGQIPLDPATGQFVGAGDIQAQTERVILNLKGVLQAAGLSLAHVVRTTVYLVDLAEFAKMNEIYGRHFDIEPPARSTVQVSSLPRGARVEIDAIAKR